MKKIIFCIFNAAYKQKRIFFYHILFVSSFINYAVDSSFLSLSDSDAQSHVNSILNSMTLEEKIAQLFMIQVSLESDKSELEEIKNTIKTYDIGGIFLSHEGTIDCQIALVNKLQKLSKYPLLVGQDLEWGLSMRLVDGLIFPKAMTLGALKDNSLLYKVAREIGRQCKNCGVHINTAPVLDINTNKNNPVIGMRSFGDNKYKVTEKALSFMRGLQDENIISCGKHFPGHGDTNIDSHFDLPIVNHDYQKLHNIELYSFTQAINYDIDAIMTAHIIVPALDPVMPASLSSKITSNNLKKELNFKGLIITDALDMKAITKLYTCEQANLRALQAGADIILFLGQVKETIALIKKAIKHTIISEKEIDNRVLKIIKVKEKLKLYDNRFIKLGYDFNTIFAQDLSKELYKKAITAYPNAQSIKNLLDNKNIKFFTFGNDFFFLKNIVYRDRLISNKLKTNKLGRGSCPLSRDKTILIALYVNHKGIYNPEDIEAINTLIKSYKNTSILLLFGPPYMLEHFPKDTPTLVAYEYNNFAQEAVAALILENSAPEGVLPVKL